MSSTISITKGFGIPFVLFHSSPQFDQSVLRSSGIEKFLAGKTRVLFFNPPICQKMRVGAEKINLSAEVFATHARCYFTANPFRSCIEGSNIIERENIDTLTDIASERESVNEQ